MKEIKRISLTDSAVENIKEELKNGNYSSGDKLPTEAMLCDRLGVSRTTVREAIRVLQTQGYVEIRPGKGAFVASTDPSANKSWYDVEGAAFRDYMEVRMAIETLAVRLAVERATDESISSLEDIHRNFVIAVREKSFSDMVTLDEQFHTRIVNLSDNQLLKNINRELITAFHIYRSESFMYSDVYKNAVIPHEKILACFQERNSAKAVKEMRKHLDITLTDMNSMHNGHDPEKE